MSASKYWFVPKVLRDTLRPYKQTAFFYVRIVSETLKDLVLPPYKHTPPMPPAYLRRKVVGFRGLNRHTFAKAGRDVADDMIHLAKENGYQPNEFTRVLEFGCGCARSLGYLNETLTNVQFCGADLDAAMINWCRAKYPSMRFVINGMTPPMDFPDEYFDWIIGVSVFTHLDSDIQHMWLEELRRVSKCGALILLSVHGDFMAKQRLISEQLTILQDAGFYYFRSAEGWFKTDGLPDFYQHAFHTRAYIEHEWVKYFDIVDYVERGVSDMQDVVVLRRL